MKDYSDRPDTIPVRLLETKNDFYRYTDEQNLKTSKAIRHMIKQITNAEKSLTPTQQKELLEELSSLRNQLSRVGGNLNQIARYFHQHDHLIESDLKKNLDEVRRLFLETNKALKDFTNVIR